MPSIPCISHTWNISQSWLDFNKCLFATYRQVSNTRRTLVSNKIVDYSDVVGTAPTCSNYIFILDLTPGFIGLGKDNCKPRGETVKFGNLVRLILEIHVTLFSKYTVGQLNWEVNSIMVDKSGFGFHYLCLVCMHCINMGHILSLVMPLYVSYVYS